MSTDHIDRMLRARATEEADSRIKQLCRAFTDAVSELAQESSGICADDVRSMALNALLVGRARVHFVQWMELEAGSGKGKALLIEGIHQRLAKEFVEKVDHLAEEVDELRGDLAYRDGG